MDTIELLQRLAVALAIGSLIGLERGWQAREDPEGGRAVGFRTHALSALLGGIWGAMSVKANFNGAIALSLAFMTFSSAIVLFRYRETVNDGTFGVTTVISAMLAFTLGAFTVIGDQQVAAAGGVAVAGLLALKAALHSWVKRLSWVELRSALVLLAMTFILLPVLPNRTIDPWSSLNPFEIWLMTIMIAALSFAGYVAVKLTGEERGIVLSGIGGGLSSSTATTVILSRMASRHPEHMRLMLSGALFSGATMVARVFAIVAALNQGMIARLALPLALTAGVLAISGVGFMIYQNRSGEPHDEIDLKNPFDLAVVLKFGALLAAVMLASKIAAGAAGNAGTYAIAAVSGLADVDAITLSMARLGGGQLSPEVAAGAIGIVVAINTLSKAILGWIAGGLDVGWRLLAVSAAAIAAGGTGFLLGGAA